MTLIEDCDDTDVDVYGDNGGSEDCPSTTCLDILDAGDSNGDGTYWIDPDDSGAFEVYCDMSTDGGGWTVVWGRSDSPLLFDAVDLNGFSDWTLTNTEMSVDSYVSCTDTAYGMELELSHDLSQSEIYSTVSWSGTGIGDGCMSPSAAASSGLYGDGFNFSSSATQLWSTTGSVLMESYTSADVLRASCQCGGVSGQDGQATGGLVMVR